MTSIAAAPSVIALYEGLVAAADGNSQRLGTLYRLKQACEALVAGGRDFSLKDIEAYCKTTFSKGPNAQSVSNDRGLRAYVDACRSEAELIRRGRPRSPLDQDIEAIPDMDLRSRMRVLVEDYRLIQKRFRILTEALAKLELPLDLDALLRGERKPATSVGSTLAPVADVDQVAALKRLVGFLRDPERLCRAGLDVDGGDVIGRGLRESVADARDIALLETLLAALER